MACGRIPRLHFEICYCCERPINVPEWLADLLSENSFFDEELEIPFDVCPDCKELVRRGKDFSDIIEDGMFVAAYN